MGTNNMSDATKVLILVATVIMVCVLCAVGFKMVNEGKSSVNASTNNFNNMTSQYSEVDLAIYDGADVQGSEVVNLIKKTVDAGGKELAIGVKTNESDMVYYNKSYDGTEELKEPDEDYQTNVEEIPIPESSALYINPTAQFAGKIHKNINGMIICIEFTQVN